MTADRRSQGITSVSIGLVFTIRPVSIRVNMLMRRLKSPPLGYITIKLLTHSEIMH